MRIVEVQVFTIDELSDSAKEKAYEQWVNKAEYWNESENRDVLNEFERIFPIKVRHWEYDQWNYHIRFSFYNCYSDQDIQNLSGLELHKHLMNRYFEELFPLKTIFPKRIKQGSKSRKSKILRTNDCVLTGLWLDQEMLQPIYDFLKKPCKHTTFYDLMRDCLDAWGSACVKDMNHCFTEEYFKEESQANEYEFTANGKRWN